LVDVFRLIKGRIEWASNCSVDLIMQLFFALLRARLGCPARSRKNACKVALRVDKVIRVSTTKKLYWRSRVLAQPLSCPVEPTESRHHPSSKTGCGQLTHTTISWLFHRSWSQR
jgi:hypothetical protein